MCVGCAVHDHDVGELHHLHRPDRCALAPRISSHPTASSSLMSTASPRRTQLWMRHQHRTSNCGHSVFRASPGFPASNYDYLAFSSASIIANLIVPGPVRPGLLQLIVRGSVTQWPGTSVDGREPIRRARYVFWTERGAPGHVAGFIPIMFGVTLPSEIAAAAAGRATTRSLHTSDR